MFVKPILSKTVQRLIDGAVSRYKNAVRWKQWGLDRIREQGTCFLLYGPPGTGKTVIANYISLKVRKKGIKSLDFSEFGSQIPGENARQIRRFFKDAQTNGQMTVFLDECEAVLWSRDRIAGSNTWMLEVIDALLVEIGKYPGLVILATNRPDMLDAGIFRRCVAIIEVPPPEFPERIKIWDAKWPTTYPLELTPDLLKTLAEFNLTGSEIETVILRVSGEAINEDRLPTVEDFCNVAREFEATGRNIRAIHYAPKTVH